MPPPFEFRIVLVLFVKLDFTIRSGKLKLTTATPPPASALLPVNVLFVMLESAFALLISVLIPPPKLLATLLLKVLLVTLRPPRAKIAPPPPAPVLEKLSLKVLSLTFSAANTKSAPPEPDAMLLLKTQLLIVRVLPPNETAPPSPALLKALLTVMPEIVAIRSAPLKVKIR